jgi:uncharacterized protein YeaO (DUF488 family)
MLRTKPVYDPAQKTDGTRVLVMRLWPWGIKKSAVDLWLKELRVELANLRAFKAGRIGWPEMRRRYLADLKREPAASALKQLRGLSRRGRVTVLCSCEDEKRCHRSLLRAVVGLVLTLSVISLATAPALAEHEPQFRYTVVGYVKDAAGKPRAGQSLEVVREKTGFAYVGETDVTGLYVIVTRLADESRGERLLVRAGLASLMIAARFDPADHVSERGTQVDFTGSRVTERAELFPATLKQFLGK